MRLRPYGLAFTKATARAKGINPVWYVGMRWGQDSGLWAALNALRQEAMDAGFANATAKALPFIEPMMTSVRMAGSATNSGGSASGVTSETSRLSARRWR